MELPSAAAAFSVCHERGRKSAEHKSQLSVSLASPKIQNRPSDSSGMGTRLHQVPIQYIPMLTMFWAISQTRQT